MRTILLFIAIAPALAACGAAGPPERPNSAQTAGISVTGEARIGVTGTLR